MTESILKHSSLCSLGELMMTEYILKHSSLCSLGVHIKSIAA